MDPHEPNSSTIHRASSIVHPRRLASVIPTPRLARQHRLVESYIRPIRAEPNDDIERDDNIPESDDSFPPSLRCTLSGVHVDIPDLLGSDLSQHPLVFLHANEVRIIVVCLLSRLL